MSGMGWKAKNLETNFQFLSNVNSELGFLMPAFVDSKFNKCQIFCTTRNMTDIVGKFSNLTLEYIDQICNIIAAFLKSEFNRLYDIVETVPGVEKLTGDNSKEEKERVIQKFKEG